MITPPKEVWLRCGHRVTDSRPDLGCSCGRWTRVQPRRWHIPADLDLAEKIAWINLHTGNRRPFRYPREWQPIEPKDET